MATMHAPRRRLLARGCIAGAVASASLAGLGTAAAQGEGPGRPDVFRSTASAQVASVFLDRDALLPVNDALRFIALDSTGSYETSNQTARASVLYPGNGVVSGPSLACGTFGAQFPPEMAPVLEACSQYRYPLTVFADSLHPDGESTGSQQLGDPRDPVSGKAVRAVAHAGPDRSTSEATMTGLRVLGLPATGPVDLPLPGVPELDPTILAIDSATSATTQLVDDAGALVVESTAVLDGVRLIGGLVEIESIRSVSRVVDDAAGTQTRHADLAVSGVTVAGVPARLTDDGLVVGSPTGADGPLVQQLTGAARQLLDALGVRVTALTVEDGVDDAGVAFARAGGLLVELDVDVRGAPILPGPMGDVDPNGIYRGTIVLGQTGATGLAATIAPLDPAITDAGLDLPPVDLFDGPGSGASSAGPAVDTAAAPVPAEASSPAPATGATSRIVSLAEPLAAGRVALVYLAFTLTALGLCAGPRFVLPARLPGGGR